MPRIEFPRGALVLPSSLSDADDSDLLLVRFDSEEQSKMWRRVDAMKAISALPIAQPDRLAYEEAPKNVVLLPRWRESELEDLSYTGYETAVGFVSRVSLSVDSEPLLLRCVVAPESVWWEGESYDIHGYLKALVFTGPCRPYALQDVVPTELRFKGLEE